MPTGLIWGVERWAKLSSHHGTTHCANFGRLGAVYLSRGSWQRSVGGGGLRRVLLLGKAGRGALRASIRGCDGQLVGVECDFRPWYAPPVLSHCPCSMPGVPGCPCPPRRWTIPTGDLLSVPPSLHSRHPVCAMVLCKTTKEWRSIGLHLRTDTRSRVKCPSVLVAACDSNSPPSPITHHPPSSSPLFGPCPMVHVPNGPLGRAPHRPPSTAHCCSLLHCSLLTAGSGTKLDPLCSRIPCQSLI